MCRTGTSGKVSAKTEIRYALDSWMIPISPNNVMPSEKMVTQRSGKATNIVDPAAPGIQRSTPVHRYPLTYQSREENSHIAVFIIWNILQARPKSLNFSQSSRDLKAKQLGPFWIVSYALQDVLEQSHCVGILTIPNPALDTTKRQFDVFHRTLAKR